MTTSALLYEFERRKELGGGAVVERCHSATREGISAIRRNGDDAIVTFGALGKGVFRIGHTT